MITITKLLFLITCSSAIHMEENKATTGTRPKSTEKRKSAGLRGFDLEKQKSGRVRVRHRSLFRQAGYRGDRRFARAVSNVYHPLSEVPPLIHITVCMILYKVPTAMLRYYSVCGGGGISKRGEFG